MARKSKVEGRRIFLDFENPRKSATIPKTDNNTMGYIYYLLSLVTVNSYGLPAVSFRHPAVMIVNFTGLRT